jgi:hypothetical protein
LICKPRNISDPGSEPDNPDRKVRRNPRNDPRLLHWDGFYIPYSVLVLGFQAHWRYIMEESVASVGDFGIYATFFSTPFL